MRNLSNTLLVVSLNAGGTRTTHYIGEDKGDAEKAYAAVMLDSSKTEVCLADLHQTHTRRHGTPAANAALIERNKKEAETFEEKKSEAALAESEAQREKLARQLALAEENAAKLRAENERIKSGKKK